jgi:hypothetical protein
MTIVTFILGIIWGVVIYHLSISIKNKINNKKLLNDISSKFLEVLNNLKSKKALFISRINNTVVIDMRIKELDVVNLIYLIDKNIVCIFKDNQCLYTTDSINKSLQSEILNELNDKFNREINDVIDVMGMVISKEEFQNKIREISNLAKNNIDIEELLKDKNETETIEDDNESKHDIDEILDKINKHGLKSLNYSEIDFLNNYSKNI